MLAAPVSWSSTCVTGMFSSIFTSTSAVNVTTSPGSGVVVDMLPMLTETAWAGPEKISMPMTANVKNTLQSLDFIQYHLS